MGDLTRRAPRGATNARLTARYPRSSTCTSTGEAHIGARGAVRDQRRSAAMTVLALGAAMLMLTLVPSGAASGQLADPGRSVALTRVVGPITPVTDEHLAAAIAIAAE